MRSFKKGLPQACNLWLRELPPTLGWSLGSQQSGVVSAPVSDLLGFLVLIYVWFIPSEANACHVSPGIC